MAHHTDCVIIVDGFKILAGNHPHFQYLATTSYMSMSKKERDSLSKSMRSYIKRAPYKAFCLINSISKNIK